MGWGGCGRELRRWWAYERARAVESFERVPAWPYGGDREAERADLLRRLVRARVRAGAGHGGARGAPYGRRPRRRRGPRRAAAPRLHGLDRADGLADPALRNGRPAGGAPGAARPRGRGACRLLCACATELSDSRIPAASRAAREAVALAGEAGGPALRAGALAALVRELDADLERRERDRLGCELEALGTAHDRWPPLVRAVHPLLGRGGRAPAGGAVHGVRAGVPDAGARGGRRGRPGAPRAHRGPGRGRRCGYATARQGSPHTAGYEGFGPAASDLSAVALAEAGEYVEAGQVLAQAGPLPGTTSSRCSGPSAR